MRGVRLSREVQAAIRAMHPALKRRIRAALDTLWEHPSAGKPLRRELAGWWSFRVGRVRIIYRTTRTVLFLPMDFYQQIEREYEPALELEEMLLTRRPEEIFAAEDGTDWNEWVAFFSRTREPDGRRKGLVEIRL